MEFTTELDFKRLSKGAIGGIAVGGCAGVLLVLVGVFLWHRRRAGRSGLTHVEDPSGLADYGTGPVTFHTPSLPLTAEWYPPLPVPATVVHPPSTSPPQSNSSASNSDSRHRLIMHNPNPSLTGPADIAGALLDIAPVSSDTRPHQNPAQVCASWGAAFHSLISTISHFCRRCDRYRNLEAQILGFSQTPRCCRCYPEPTFETCGCKWRVDRKTSGPSFSYRNLNTKGTFYRQITTKLQNLSHRCHVDHPSPSIPYVVTHGHRYIHISYRPRLIAFLPSASSLSCFCGSTVLVNTSSSIHHDSLYPKFFCV